MEFYLLAAEMFLVCLSDSVFPAKADQRSLGYLNSQLLLQVYESCDAA